MDEIGRNRFEKCRQNAGVTLGKLKANTSTSNSLKENGQVSRKESIENIGKCHSQEMQLQMPQRVLAKSKNYRGMFEVRSPEK